MKPRLFKKKYNKGKYVLVWLDKDENVISIHNKKSILDLVELSKDVLLENEIDLFEDEII